MEKLTQKINKLSFAFEYFKRVIDKKESAIALADAKRLAKEIYQEIDVMEDQ